VPGLVLPDGLKPKGLGVQPDEVPFDPPLTPNYPLQPAPPPYDKPQYGADWTGLKPFQVTLVLCCNACWLVKTCACKSACQTTKLCRYTRHNTVPLLMQ